MSDIRQLSEQYGFKLTPLRADVLQLFTHAHEPLKAYEILNKIQSIRPNAKPPTVYRVLDFLIKQGVLHRLDTRNAYSLCQIEHSHGKDPKGIDILLICQLCSKIVEFTDIVLTSLVQKIQDEKAISITSEQIELKGKCSDCLTS